MKRTKNTSFITGGGTGTGRGLAEALHELDSKVIISRRRVGPLKAVAAANPGIETVILDVLDPKAI